jgi:hypothetical protein
MHTAENLVRALAALGKYVYETQEISITVIQNP